jgi:murein DD-endopeptidase MepM/ murein hydrolase activator NlpD
MPLSRIFNAIHIMRETLNRRRFLKYAGTTAVIAGASALSLDFILKPQAPKEIITQELTQSTKTAATSAIQSTQSTSVIESTSSTLSPPLSGRVFFDYNGNGKQDAGEPAIPNAGVQLVNDAGSVAAHTVADSSGYYAFDGVPSGTYSLMVSADAKFRYKCASVGDFSDIAKPYRLVVQKNTILDIGLIEGFLTMPLRKGTQYRINAYFDEGGDKNYLGQPNGDPGHEGTDFGVPIGTPVYCVAPGFVKYVDDWGPVGIFVIVSHEEHVKDATGNPMSTLYAHLSKADVSIGQSLSRGSGLGLSGQDNTHPGPHLHFELDSGFHGSPTRNSSYKPIDPFRSLWIPNALGYWTKDNDPQYPVT